MMCLKLIRNYSLATLLLLSIAGCSAYYKSKAEDMAQRQMDAMVFVEGGEFMMGNPGGWDGSKDSWPSHKVVLDDFYIQKFEVTQGDFELFQAATNYEHSHEFYDKYRDEKPERYASELPAVASWTDASAFCHFLGETSGQPATLPTEAQWEYAARARGKMVRYATGNGKAVPDVTMAAKPESSRYDDINASKVKLPLAPGHFEPNELGLYDMSGNVGEWVRDKYKEGYYKNSPVHNPLGPSEAQKGMFSGNNYRVLRGGSYKDFIGNTTVTRRKGSEPLSSEIRGFRCSH